MIVNFGELANSAEKDEKMSIGVEEPHMTTDTITRDVLNAAYNPRFSKHSEKAKNIIKT